MPCRSSTACRFPDDVLHEANICFSSLPLAECEGLLGMPTSTKVSEPETVFPCRSHTYNRLSCRSARGRAGEPGVHEERACRSN